MSILSISRLRQAALVILALVLSVGLVGRSSAENAFSVETKEPGKLELVVGKSIVLKSSDLLKRISIGAPEVADYVLLSPREIYITGKKPGITNLILWQEREGSVAYEIDVTYDISRLKQKLHEILPNEEEIRVMAIDDSITLSGRVSNTANLSQVVALAEEYATKDKVHNLLEVAGIHQVLLEVRVAEMSKNLSKRLGINFGYQREGEFVISLLKGLTSFDEGIFTYSPNVNALFRLNSGSATWTGFVDALKEEGLVKILAEPTLIAYSGRTATFLGGGEFPVPEGQGLGTVGIAWKEFGVGLVFTPTVLDDNKISLNVAPEVSELDFSIGTAVLGTMVPGLTTRRASTVVELADGQSFAIAGLLQENVQDVITKFPGLGDLPVLGPLFRSREFQKSETELVIIVTPHLVKPLDLAGQPLPTDYYVEPNAKEFYYHGLLEGREGKPASPFRVKLDGDFGHSIPLSD